VSTGSITPAQPPESPSALWLALEGPRAFWEMREFVAAGPALRLAPRGNGRPVLLLPGFLSDDDATAALRQYLCDLGHAARPWQLGTNLGPTEGIMDGLERRLDELASASGGPVSLVGVSLGGLFARHLARHMPESVGQVITLGSPFRIASKAQSHVAEAYDALSHLHVEPARFSVWGGARQPLPVRSTAIYTRTDGVVAWQTCVDESSCHAENIEVVGSHCGLAHLPSAAYAVADRLAQRADSWQRFVPPLLLRHLYPSHGSCAG
jgi:pimeloyl-ACP methyl ester carboxylesterase